MKAAYWNYLFKYGLGLGALAYVVIWNWTALKQVLERPIDVRPLLLALVVAACGLLITFLRWHLLVRAVGLPFSVYNAIRLGLVGYYYSNFLPSSVGGDVIKAYFIAREQGRRTVAVATVIVDRVIGLWALVWFVALIGGTFWLYDDPLLANDGLRAIVRYSLIFVGITITIWFVVGFLNDAQAEKLAGLLLRLPLIGNSAAEFWRACWMYRKQSRAVLIAMLMSFVGHTGWVLVFHLSVRAFQTPHPEVDIGTLPEHLIVVPVGMVIQALFPSPGGIGGGELAYQSLYEILGKPGVNGFVGCMSQRVIFWTLGIIGYIVYLRMRVSIDEPKPAEAEPQPDSRLIGDPVKTV